MAAGQEGCPACGASLAPPVEGALAPDPSALTRPEPLREIPGLKKKERTWKDEVRERMHDRKRRRSGDPDLPLFREAEADAGDEAREEPAPGAEAPAVSAPPPPLRPRRAGPAAPRTPPAVEIGAEEPDLPLREAAPSMTAGPELRVTGGAAEIPLGELRPPVEKGLPAEEWSLGAEPAAEPRPVERPAHAGERAQAALLDLVLLGGLWVVVVYFACRAAHVDLRGLMPAWPWLAGYLAFLGLAYAGYFTGTTGQTLGKIATGLRVVDGAGRPPGYLRAFARGLLGSLGVMLAGVGLLPMLVDPARRALHDRLFKTRVVRG